MHGLAGWLSCVCVRACVCEPVCLHMCVFVCVCGVCCASRVLATIESELWSQQKNKSSSNITRATRPEHGLLGVLPITIPPPAKNLFRLLVFPCLSQIAGESERGRERKIMIITIALAGQ
uniref:Putative secreted protein n=1 Tax=Anopheles triannulatus TaxID=58253 RepID=A0A2M4B3V9_9DIPT